MSGWWGGCRIFKWAVGEADILQENLNEDLKEKKTPQEGFWRESTPGEDRACAEDSR